MLFAHLANGQAAQGQHQQNHQPKGRDTMSKHTPGPWKLHLSTYPNGKLSGRPYIYAPNGPDTHRHIAEPFIDERAAPELQSMQEANACLIAAAPELLAALEYVSESASFAGLNPESLLVKS